MNQSQKSLQKHRKKKQARVILQLEPQLIFDLDQFHVFNKKSDASFAI